MSQSDVHDYLTEIGRHPVLSKEAQLRHCRRIHAWVHHEDGRDAAPLHIRRAGSRSMEVMARTNLRLVVSIARRYQNRGLDMADLIQEGNLGLIRGLELFDPTRGYAVSTYCYWWIRQAITRALHTHSRPIRLPINTHELIARIQRISAEHISIHGTSPSIAALAEATGITPERVTQVLETHAVTACCSLDAYPTEGSNAIVDLIPDPSFHRDSEPDEALERTSSREAIEDAFQFLNPNEIHVIRACFFDERPLRDIADDLGVTRCRISQIQRSALNKLRLFLGETFLPH
jgi:RNA polymerase sigma factor (sigma-70 family)